MFSSTKLLLNAFCLLIIAMYLFRIKHLRGVNRLVFSAIRLSYQAHNFFLVLLDALVEDSKVVLEKVRCFMLVQAIL